MIEDWKAGGFGLYIHWPFCEAKCPYCDFNSHVSASVDQSRWLYAYLSELDRYAKELPNRVLNTVFFGGGTPSLMNPEIVVVILEKIQSLWTVANNLEVTLEANPSSVEASRFRGYAEAGVNRISVGVQALNDQDLKRLGRLHTVAEAFQAIEIAEEFFDRVSFDLIYGRQNQTLRSWEAELQEALGIATDHVSLYQLTIEQGTAFADRYNLGKLKGLPGEDLAADMFFLTQDICDAAGLPAYEVSNHAKPGMESRHNLIYWRYGDYVGIGPGAHGRITKGQQKFATETWLSPDKWLSAARFGNGEKSRKQLSRNDQAIEYLLMGLRTSEGICLDRYQDLKGSSLSSSAISQLRDLGMLETKNGRAFTTKSGRMVLNSVISELL